MTRQLREIIGRVQRGLPRLNAGPVTGRLANWRVVGRLAFLVLTLATAITACVVTENKDFVGATSPPIPVATSPPRLTRVPLQGDADCTGAPSMQFEATVLDLDVESTLFARLSIVGGAAYIPRTLDRTGKTTRSFSLCVPYTDLIAPCSVVELFVSSDLNAVFFPPPTGVLDPSAKFGPIISWTVLGPASGSQADAKWSDCSPDLQPDGGV